VSTYEERVERVRQTMLGAASSVDTVEPAAVIHAMTLVLAQAVVLLRSSNTTSPADALQPVKQMLDELVNEWWGMGGPGHKGKPN